jgi:hypothetical protein
MERRHFRYVFAAILVAAVTAWLMWPSGAAVDRDLPRAGAAEANRALALGYGAAFQAELTKIGQISPRQFAERYGGKASYLPKPSWDPTAARFWGRFSLDPNAPGQKVRLRAAEERRAREHARRVGRPIPEGQPILVPTAGGYDFRLNAEELATFKANGFVVSERMGAPSCTELFYRVYKRDLPVFVSADAILHAWHRSFDALLVEVEAEMLIPALSDLLAAMAAQVPDARAAYGRGLLAPSLADADSFLAVARSLLAGSQVRSALGQEDRVQQTLSACDRQQLEKFDLFGRARELDFSQFKPRGHYEKTEGLRRYFRAMMWCGRIDLRVAGDPKEASPRELGGAVVLHDLLRRSGHFEKWQQFDRVLRTFVGQADSMTFAQLGAVLDAAGVASPGALKDEASLTAIQGQILAGKFGAQEIRGDVFDVDLADPQKFVLPRSFTLLGQRFVLDSWATSQVVYDDVFWDGKKVMRRVPSCLDVAFAVLGNDHAVPELARRMTDAAGRKFRDGLNYQHNLAAVREVIGRQGEAAWSRDLYSGWLACLRELSKPTTAAKYPEAMRTRAWAMKSLNTQLASWAQLRHDTVLYAKQSYTMRPLCHYPAGFVEPVPHFWAEVERMVARAARLIEQAPYSSRTAQDKQVKFLRNFAAKVSALRQIAEKELAQQELSAEETKLLEDVVETSHQFVGSGGPTSYAGWYPGLFYAGAEDAMKWDAVAADVHTNPPAPVVGDPGCVLHQAVGSVDLLIVAIDNGKDRMAYAGPLLSHYEFEMPGVSRKSDAEWQKDLREGRAPARPAWTRGYLVPGKNKELPRYRSE